MASVENVSAAHHHWLEESCRSIILPWVTMGSIGTSLDSDKICRERERGRGRGGVAARGCEERKKKRKKERRGRDSG